MKLRPVLTASAVASVIAAASIVPAYASHGETIIEDRIIAILEIDLVTGPDDPESSPAGEEQADDPASGNATPEPEEETEEDSDAEVSEEPAANESENSGAEAEETPGGASVQTPSVTTESDASGDASNSSNPAQATESATPMALGAASATISPLVGNSATEMTNSTPQGNAGQSNSSPLIEANPGMSFVASEDDQAEPEETRIIPPEPRVVDTLEIDRGENTPEPRDERSNQTEARNAPERDNDQAQAAEPPAPVEKETLAEAGASSLALALGGVTLIAGGAVLVVMHRRNQRPQRGRRAKR